MLAVRKTEPTFGVRLDDVPEPTFPGPGEVLVDVAAVGICGSDVHVYQWTQGYDFMKSRLPVTLGHEFSGTVVKLGEGVKHVDVGDRVAVMPSISCMNCSICASGRPTLCPNKETLGLTKNGAFAKYVIAPALGCIKLDGRVDMVLASLIEPLCVGDNVAQVGEISSGSAVVVLGPGTIGQAVVRAARWRGATFVLAVGLNDPSRLNVSRQMGATHTFDLASGKTLREAMDDISPGMMADVVVEATGQASSITDGFGVLKRGGILVAAGIHSKPVSFDVTSMIRNKQQLRGAHGSHREAWEIMAKRIVTEPDSIRPMVSVELDLQQADEGFKRCLARDVSKVILRPS